MSAKPLYLLFFIAAFGGCSSIPSEDLVPSQIILKQVDGISMVRVSGSRQEIVKNEDIKLAIEKAISQSDLFSQTGRTLRVNVSVLSIENPLFGLDLRSDMRIRWQVYDEAASEEVFNAVVTSSHTSTFGDQVVAVARMKEANAEAMKKNIAEALQDVSNALANKP